MNRKTNDELLALVHKATEGDKKALETLVADVQDIVFNLSLRMLGTFADAEDAAQDILLKMITLYPLLKAAALLQHGYSALRSII